MVSGNLLLSRWRTSRQRARVFPRSSRRMAGIEVRRRLLLALWDHFCRIRLPRYSPRPELFSLDVIFGLSWPSVVNLTADLDALVVDLPAGFPFRYHLLDPLLGEPRRPIVDRSSRHPQCRQLASRDQTKNYCHDNRTQKTGDENGTTTGRVE